MTSLPLRNQLLASLTGLVEAPLQSGATHLLAALGYASGKTIALPTEPRAFATELAALTGTRQALTAATACLADWRSAAFLFQLTNDELPTLAAGQMGLLPESGGVQSHQVESFVFLALDLKPGNWSRTRLAGISRELNKLFPMPAVVLFRYPNDAGSPLLSIAVIHRRTNKVDASKDVIEGKVSIVKDIDLQQPNAAHLRILESMALAAVDSKFVPSNFEALYKAWLKVLDVKALNDRFYKDLAEWYYWAIRSETGVQFPKGQPLEVSDDPATNKRPTVAVIRLLTRLIFVWFLKEKKLIPEQLFAEKSLASLLKKAPSQAPGESNYYKAILQNLFFATLNTEMAEQDEDGNRQRVWKEDTGPKRLTQYLIHNVYRYQKDFKDPAAALALFQQVPFLNGGLFECLDKHITAEDMARDPSLAARIVPEGKQHVLRVDGFSERTENPLHIPNELFFGEGDEEIDLNGVFGTKNKKYKPRGLLKIFDSYKFTIEENTPVEEEVALDPELLGKVFENLLASYNPDTKTTARKKSGSFYTPREVVDYMVDEALVCYLEPAFGPQQTTTSNTHGLLDLDHGPGDLPLMASDNGAESATSNGVLPQRLRRLLSFRQTSHDFSRDETLTLIAAIERMRVLDPACGSGAFPMGMLQKLVHVLRKLDPDNTLWKTQNRAPLEEHQASAKKLKDPTLRDEQSTAAQAALEKFDADFADPEYADYARKLYLIEKCLYGVDIQPIAVQIAKLRFFISLVVEQKLGTDHQRLTPLPNLETKIVAANTLLPIPRSGAQQSLLTNPKVAKKEAELREANASHFAAKRFGDKRRRKTRILKLRDELAQLLKGETMLAPGDGDRMTAWDPFDQNIHANFFDPEWMYGFQQGFDIVIGNPPYVRQEAIKEQKPELKPHYPHSYSGTADLYVYFYERSFQLLKPGGCLSFITSNKWFRAKYGADLRQYMATHTEMRQIIDFGDEAVFDALAYPTIVIATLRAKPVAADKTTNDVLVLNWDGGNEDHQVIDFPEVFAREGFAVPQQALKPGGWQLEPPTLRLLLERIRKAGQPLSDHCGGRFYRGILTGLNEAFVIDAEKQPDVFSQLRSDPKSKILLQPFLRGKDIKRWNVEFADHYLIKIESSENVTHPWSGQSPAKAEPVFAKTHPAAYAWLTAGDRREKLIERTDQGKYFWELRSCAYWDLFAEPKIVYPDIYLHQSLAWDDSGKYCANTGYFIPTGEKWLVGLLNSVVCEWFYDQISTRMQGGYLRAFTDKMKALPIPSTNETQRKTIEACIDAIRLSVSKSEFERLLNGLVYELFFAEDLHVRNIRLFDACASAGVDQGMEAQAVATEIFHPRHPIYGQLFDLQAIEVVRLIEGIDV
jgi:type I restriction-modification system DNA methylase subunit